MGWRTVVISNNAKLDYQMGFLVTSLYKELSNVAQEQLVKEEAEINQKIIEFLDKLNDFSTYNLSTDYDLDLVGIFKLYNLKICSDSDNYVEMFIDYLRIVSTICKISVFVILNLKQYFESAELEEIYKICFYEKIILINIEGYQSEPISGDKYYILDKDLCIIEV